MGGWGPGRGERGGEQGEVLKSCLTCGRGAGKGGFRNKRVQHNERAGACEGDEALLTCGRLVGPIPPFGLLLRILLNPQQRPSCARAQGLLGFPPHQPQGVIGGRPLVLRVVRSPPLIADGLAGYAVRFPLELHVERVAGGVVGERVEVGRKELRVGRFAERCNLCAIQAGEPCHARRVDGDEAASIWAEVAVEDFGCGGVVVGGSGFGGGETGEERTGGRKPSGDGAIVAAAC